MTKQTLDIAGDLLRRARHVRENEAEIGVYSTGEAIAVALILNRPDLLPRGWTILQAVDRLGEEWLRAAKIAEQQL